MFAVHIRRGHLLVLLLAVDLRSEPPLPPPPQQWVSRVWRTQDGLPENRIRTLAQTPDGYLWAGTTGGLARFDGVRFVTYTRFNTPEMSEDNIRGLAVGGDGSLWVATDGGGLLNFKNGKLKAYSFKSGLASDFVASVLEDRRGHVWAATNRGLFHRQGDTFVRLDEALKLPAQAFFSLVETADGASVLAGSQGGLFRMTGGSSEMHRESTSPEEVFRMRALGNGSVWLSTNHGLRTIGSKDTANLVPLNGKAIGSIGSDRAGNVWVGTLGSGLYVYRQGRGSPLPVPAGLPDPSVLAILEDREQGMWIGTADGLVRLIEPDVGVIDQRHGLGNANVVTVHCAASGALWLTTAGGEVFRRDPRAATFGRFPLPGAAAGLRVQTVHEAPGGVIWFGTDNQGAVRLDPSGAVTRVGMRQGLRNNGIQFLQAADKGSMWIGTTSGLGHWDGRNIRNYYLGEGLSYGWVRSIARDGADWLVGTDRGLNRMRNGEFIQDPVFDAMKRDRVWSIYRESDGTLWLGTRGDGLVRVRNGQVRRITTREGLTSNTIFQVLNAGDDRLWMSGPNGISSASLRDLNAAADARLEGGGALSYRVSTGQESDQINGGIQQAGCVAADGEIWFPGVQGAIHFKSRRPPVRRHMPVRIEAVHVDDDVVAAGEQAVIEAGRRRVRIEFTSNSLRAPEGVTFRYKLDGYDPQWIPVTGARAAEYDNLPPGQYRFQVMARDESPGPNSSQAALILVVEPRFYQTYWFYALVVLSCAAGVAAVFLLRERRARQVYNLRLDERTRIAREMHDTLVQGCVGVSTLIEAAVGSARSDESRLRESLDNARIHLRLTIDEARQALADLRHNSFDRGLTGALEELVASFNNGRAGGGANGNGTNGVAVTLHAEGDPVPLGDVANRALVLVTREAIRNALTHGAPTAIEVSLLYGASAIELDIHDNGRGFAMPAGTLAAWGHFGVLGMRERLEQIGGQLDLASEPGMGTTVSARLPFPAAAKAASSPAA